MLSLSATKETIPDFPYEVRDDNDLSSLVEDFRALPSTAPNRTALRNLFIAEYSRRIEESLRHKRRPLAYQMLQNIGTLWNPEELAILETNTARATKLRRSLLIMKPQVLQLLGQFSRSGEDERAVACLALLKLMEPTQTATYLAEIDQIFAHADELSIASIGPGSQQSRPIHILEQTITFLPAPFLIERLKNLYVSRHHNIKHHFRRHGVNFSMIRAHGDSAIHTTWNIIRIFARANRITDALAAIHSVEGFGDNVPIRRLLTAIKHTPSPTRWAQLALAFRAPPATQKDLPAALAIALAGTRQHPMSSQLYALAGAIAHQLGDRNPQAIRLYHTSWKLSPSLQVTRALAELYTNRLTRLALQDRVQRARNILTKLEKFLHTAKQIWPTTQIHPDMADGYAGIGRGLVGIGRLGEATRYLHRSVQKRWTREGLEQLGIIALRQDNYREAIQHFKNALTLSTLPLYHRARISRLIGEAYMHLGKYSLFEHHATNALQAWERTLKQKPMASLQGDALVEMGKIYWSLRQYDRSLTAFDRAVDQDKEGEVTHAQVVSFLITRGHYDQALDTYHRALGQEKIADYFKVYMSLWVLAEARQNGQQPDRHAWNYLNSRTGPIWYDQLAQFATGRMSAQTLRQKAHRRTQQAEMLYYLAVLSHPAKTAAESRRLLQQVLQTQAIIFFEYEMAKQRLTHGRRLSKSH